MHELNKSWVLAAFPQGMPSEENWRLEENPIQEPQDGQVLAKAIYLSVDPYMRGRISPKAGYAAGVSVGEVMHGGAVAEVVDSKHTDWAPGDIFETMGFGWQEYALLDASGLNRIEPQDGIPLHAYLSYLGMPGRTAYFALEEVAKIQPGETVVVSAASGAVGQMVGQIVKLKGGRAIAVASSEEKLNWCKQLGYDTGVNYRKESDLTDAIKQACPDGVDVFFDNTAGVIHDAVMRNLKQGARVIVCGTISLADKFEEPDIGERFLRQILVTRATVRGFLVFDYQHRYPEANKQLIQWAQDGLIQFKTDIVQGIESVPSAFLKLLHSQNFGKQVVEIVVN